MTTTVVESVPLIKTAERTGRFYVRMAATFVAVAVIGFAPTYLLPIARGTLAVSPIVHLHALFFFGWTLLFWRQTTLASSGRIASHRELGVAGVALASAMSFVGFGVAINSVKHTDAAGFGAAGRAFSIIPFTAIPLFVVLVAIAILNVRKPDVHKRVMVVATASLLQAAVGRWFLLFLRPPDAQGPPPVFVSVGPGLVVDLLIVAGMIHDRRANGRVHPVYWAAGFSVLAVQLLRVPVSTTNAWMRVTDWMVALSP